MDMIQKQWLDEQNAKDQKQNKPKERAVGDKVFILSFDAILCETKPLQGKILKINDGLYTINYGNANIDTVRANKCYDSLSDLLTSLHDNAIYYKENEA